MYIPVSSPASIIEAASQSKWQGQREDQYSAFHNDGKQSNSRKSTNAVTGEGLANVEAKLNNAKIYIQCLVSM